MNTQPSTSLPPRKAVEVTELRKHFQVRAGGFSLLRRARAEVHAVSDISFSLPAGETLGIVGESGCGKSTLARLLVGLIPADAGEIRMADAPLVTDDAAALKAMRRKVQMVFQDSYASLNPRLTIETSIMFGPEVHGMRREEARAVAHRLLARVGLDPARFAGRYPHEISGGQRQRVNIARALALGPEVVVFDEAVSALDKSVEIQVLNLLAELKAELGLTYLFISHDLNVVRYISDKVLVMYLGKVVEMGPAEAVYAAPAHPYTRALLASMPSMDPRRRTESAPIAGDPPSPIDPPSGCRFRTRCPHAEAVCAEREPLLRFTGAALGAAEDAHRAACHMLEPASGHSHAPARTGECA